MFLRTRQFVLVDPSGHKFRRDIGNVFTEPLFPIESGRGLERVPFTDRGLGIVQLVFMVCFQPCAGSDYGSSGVPTPARAIYLLRCPLFDVVIAAPCAGARKFLAMRVESENNKMSPRLRLWNEPRCTIRLFPKYPPPKHFFKLRVVGRQEQPCPPTASRTPEGGEEAL